MTEPISGSSAAALLPIPGVERVSSFPSPDSSTLIPPVPQPSEVAAAVKTLSDHFGAQQNQVQFRVDHDTGRLVLSVVDAQDGTVLLQLPSDETLNLARSIEHLRTALIHRKA